MGGEIQRRELLKSAAVIGGAGVVGAQAGCAHPQPATRSPADVAALADGLDPSLVDAVLERMDRRLAWIDEQDLPQDVLPLSELGRGPQFEAERARCRRLVRKAARSLYVTGRFIDMPDEMKAHPGVQAKLQSLHKDMDDAVFGMTEVLERMTPEDHRRMQRCLRDDPGFGERLARYLERPALEDELPFRRRFGLRASILQLGGRMGAQSPALVTDPLVRKVRRIQARPHSEAEQLRLVSARMGEAAFWAHQEKMAALHAAWGHRLGRSSFVGAAQGTGGSQPATGGGTSPPATAPAASPAVAAPSPPPATAPVAPKPQATDAEAAPAATEPEEEPGVDTIGTGAIIMGFGAGSILLGLGFWGLAELTAVEGFIYPAVVLGVTVGPILLIVGLVAVLVGVAMQASG